MTDATEVDDDDRSLPEGLSPLPASCKLVYLVIASKGPISQQALVEESQLSRSTVSRAVNRLEREGVIRTRYSGTDARQKMYQSDT